LLLACAIIGLTFGWPRITRSKRSAPLSGSKVKWTPTRADSARRLEDGMNFVESHTNANDADCIVGGYETENPLKIYVGGPCSSLDINGSDVTPADDFRWMVMETIHVDITDGNNSVPMLFVLGSEVVVPHDNTTHAEIAVGGSMVVDDANMDHAAIYSCTTSYVAKDTFSFNTNSFVISEHDRIEQCVAPCCSDPGYDGCNCSNGCDGEMIEASAGMFKYSIMAAAHNTNGSTAGATGNGWERVVEEVGEVKDGVKQIEGSMDIYQILDFTSMSADILTITSSLGATMYSSMGTCDFDTGAGCDDNYALVENMTVESGTWTGRYAFPQTYNLGSWDLTETGEINATVESTKKVNILAFKPTAQSLTNMGFDGKMAVILSYRFDISGITADETSGKWMNYDPVVTSGLPVSSSMTTAAPAAETTATQAPTDSGTNDDPTDAPTAAPTAAAAPVDASSSAWGIARGGLPALTMALIGL